MYIIIDPPIGTPKAYAKALLHRKYSNPFESKVIAKIHRYDSEICHIADIRDSCLEMLMFSDGFPFFRNKNPFFDIIPPKTETPTIRAEPKNIFTHRRLSIDGFLPQSNPRIIEAAAHGNFFRRKKVTTTRTP